MLVAQMMRPANGTHIGNIGPVPLYVDPSAIFLLIFVLFFYSGPLVERLVILSVLVLAIVLHELGHAFMARARGAEGVSICITGLGGLCTYSAYMNHKEKVMISLAGPLVNIFLAVAAYLLIAFVPPFNGPLYAVDGIQEVLWLFVYYTLMWNLVLGIFNLLPIFPMDGGQALLSGLQMAGNSEYRSRKVTLIASFVAAGVGVAVYSYATGRPIGMFMTLIIILLLYEAYRHLS